MKNAIGVRCALGATVSIVALSAAIQPATAQTADVQSTDAATQAADKTAKTGKTDKSSKDTDIIVTARRQALQTSQSIKRNADTIVDSVTADAAGVLPDNSITEVLQRVSGVTISRFTGTNGGSTAFQIEGSGLAVRGLPYTTSTVNGQQVFSANGASAISWNEVTPELMAGVDVYKASRADMIEGGASLIDLRTHLPFDFKKNEFDVTIDGSYGDQARKASPQISALYSERFQTGIGEIGLLWDLAYSRLYQQSSDLQVGAMFGEYAPTAPGADHIGLIPSSFTWSYNRNKRDRYGAYQAIQWSPASNLTFTSTVFFTKYVQDSYGNSASFGQTPYATAEMLPQLGAPVTYDADGAFKTGTLTLGGTGNAVWASNTTSAALEPPGWDWFPSQYLNLDCGGSYGSPPSSLQWDWSAGAKTLVRCSTPTTSLNPSGSSSISHSANSTLDISESFAWSPSDRLHVRAGAQYIYSRANGRSMSVAIAQNSPLVDSVKVDLTGSIPVLSGLNPAGMLDTGTVDPVTLETTGGYFAYGGYNGPKNTGKMFAGHADFEYDVSDNGFLRNISAGFRIANRTEDDDFVGTYWMPLGQSWLNHLPSYDPNDPIKSKIPGNIQYLNSSGVNPADYQVATFPNFFGGAAPLPAQVLVPSQTLMKSMDWYYLLRQYNGQIPNGTASQYWTQYVDQGLGRTQSKIFNKAVYVEAKFAHDRIGFIPAFSGNIGVRVFHESLHSTGLLSAPSTTSLYALTQADSTQYFLASKDATGATPYPTMYSINPGTSTQVRDYGYTRVLPSFNIKFDAAKNFIIRGAASEAAAPPNLNDIRAGGTINPKSVSNPGNSQAPSILTGVTVQSGGAQLKPVLITSEDLSFEYYPTPQSMFYVDFFAKQIKDQDLFASYIANNLPIPATAFDNGATSGGTATSLDVPWVYLQNKTSSVKAHLKGFEIGGRQFFDMLPGLLRGLGLEGNLTFVDSRNPAQQANNVLSPYTPNGGLNADGTIPQTYSNLPYPGLSKWSYNINLLYSLGRVNVRLAYNWRDKALLSTNVNPLSYATSGGNPYTLNTSATNFDATHSYPVYWMVPAWMASAGYMDLGIDYKLSDTVAVSARVSNLLNTTSRTLQEPVPGVFEPYDANVSDRRFDVSVRLHF
ncbi:TonB-dependent receptor [Hephaestia mangrovi]|uniref:TonB-dependent receptor n=1 Tax=Hephaestia mangrovi TaxID=2873268 RepID=UPI001CA6DEE0|nr:TonB-dependent receptor [Hephaestia mangrovi]MBY8827407.1 TonB-dependent receptor [Hephaestia mangrovi]